MEEFSGSYILTLAGYNAGPGRAREWIAEFGDPRDPKVDPIDWIERIPIQETREYVAKVLSNVQVYRARLGNPQKALQLDEDLVRARFAAGQSSREPGKRASATPDPNG
jgi:soluble lytic murein transglycosylase